MCAARKPITTAAGRQLIKHDGSNTPLPIPLPVGTIPSEKSPKEEHHLWRILEVSTKLIDKAKKDIDALFNTGYRDKTSYIKEWIHIVRTHLPEAHNELQKLVNAYVTSKKEIARFKNAHDEKIAVIQNKPIHEQAILQGKYNDRRRIEARQQTVKEKDANFEFMRSENNRLMKELEKAESKANNCIEESYERERRYVYINKTLEEDLKKKYDDEIQHLLEITQKQSAEITKYKRDYDEQRNKFQKLSNDKNVLEEIVREQKHHEIKHTEYKQSVEIERYYKVKRDVDNLLCENSKLSEKLALTNDILKIKEANFEQMKISLEAREQEITHLKQNIATQNEAQEKYENLKQKTHKLFQENQTLKKRLEHETDNLKHQVKLTLNVQEQRRQHEEEIKSLHSSFDKQQSENNKQHQKEVELLVLEINKYREELNKKHETNQAYCELRILADQLEAVNQTLREELAREKQYAKTKEEESKQSLIQIKQRWENRKNDTTEIKEAIQKQKQMREKNLKLQQEIYYLQQEKSKLCKLLSQAEDDAKYKEKEHGIIVLNLQRLREKKLEEINNIEAARKNQLKLNEENQTLRCEMQKLLKEKEQLTCSGETYRKQEEIIKSSLKLRIQNLENELDLLYNEKKKISEELLLEKDNAKIQKNEHEKTFQECIERQELEIKSIKVAFETQQTLNEKQQKEKGEQEHYKLQKTLTQIKEHAKTQEEESQNLKLELQTLKEIIARQTNELKMKNNMQQQTLCEESETVRNKNQQLMLDNRNLNDDLRLEKDNANKQANAYLKIIQEMQQLKAKQEDTVRMLKNAEDIQRTINAENLDLKNQVSSLLRDKIEREKELVQEKENAKEKEEIIKSSLNNKIHILMKDNAKLQEEHSKFNISLQQVIDKQKNEIDKLLEMNKKLGNDARQHSTDTQVVERCVDDKELQQQLATIKEQLKNTQQELDDTKSRLSRAMGVRLTDNNPNVADLSDRNRPTKISERYQELYDNKWTDAFEIVDRTIGNEEKTIEILMGILKETMAFCKAESAQQMTTITEMLSKGREIPASTMKELKDLRKASAENYGKGLYMEYWKKLNHLESLRAKVATKVPDFVKECFELCWLMAVQDPPVVLGPEIFRDTPFNKDHYKAYTQSGKRLDYVVWPVLLLHQDGPVLCKGLRSNSCCALRCSS